MAKLCLNILLFIPLTCSAHVLDSNNVDPNYSKLQDLPRLLERQFEKHESVSTRNDENATGETKHQRLQKRASESSTHTSSDLRLPVGFSKECLMSSIGLEYTGTISVTRDGAPCKPWSETKQTNPDKFPDSSVEEASNYCRNPSWSKEPWCYTAESWGYCDIPPCYETCQRTRYGQEYVGDVSVSENGHTCMEWEERNYDLNKLSESTYEEVGNKCRNPDKDAVGPWCYKSRPYTGQRWDACEVPMCKDDTLNGWTRLDDSIYKLTIEELQHDDAERACAADGGYLATVTSQEKNDMLDRLVKNVRANTWIGLVRDEDTWKWSTGAALTYETWNTDFPTVIEGHDCVQFKQKSERWRNVACTENQNYVCEIPLTEVAFPCPSGWTLFDRKCYKLFDNDETFANAAQSCAAHGSFLASIRSEKQQDFVTASFAFWSGTEFWLGATDRLEHGTFRWLDGGDLTGFARWMTTQPAIEGVDQAVEFSNGGAWDHIPQTSTNKYLCQMTACPDGYEDIDGDCKKGRIKKVFTANKYTATRGYTLEGTPLATIEGLQNANRCGTKCSMYRPVSPFGGKCVAANYNLVSMHCRLLDFGRESTLQEEAFSADDDSTYLEKPGVCTVEADDRVACYAEDERHCLAQRCCYRSGQCFLSSAYDATAFKTDGFTTTFGLKLDTPYEKTLPCETLEECVSECRAHEPIYMYKKKCAAVVYNIVTQTCYISSNSKDTVVATEGLKQDNDYLYLERDEGNCALEDYNQLSCPSTGENDCLSKGCCFQNGKCFRSRANVPVIEPAPECPLGWFYNSGSCYKLIEKQRRFQAMRKCNQESAFITSVEDQNEQDFLLRAFAKHSESFWIGADDSHEVGRYLWLDGSQSSFRNWQSGQPDRTKNNERYILMTSDGTWKVNGYTEEQNVVCKRASCAVGWTWYNNNCYKVFEEKVTAAAAASHCRRTGATLLTVQSAIKNKHFHSLAGSQAVWIGLSDVLTERKWEWQSGWAGTYTNWNTASGEPKNNRRKDCVIMTVGGHWAVKSCYNENAFICQKGYDVVGFKPYPGKYISGHNLEKIPDVSVYECAQRCRDFMLSWYDYRCASFDYDTSQRICYISDKNSETVILGEYLVWNSYFVHFERVIGSPELKTKDCVFPFIYSGSSKSSCNFHSKSEGFQWCSKTADYDTDKQWTICEDYGFCTTAPDERVSTYGTTEYLCRSVGGCWDGKSKCFQSKSQLKRILCAGKCLDVRRAALAGDPNLRDLYFDAAYAEAKSMITLPSTFWQWLDANNDAREALLTTQWPIDHETIENFYLLWRHFGEKYTTSHYHLLLATAFNRRDFGMNTHPSFIRNPSYWSWWSQDLTFLIDADSKLLKEDLSSSQKKLMADAEDLEGKKLEEASTDVNKRVHQKRSISKRSVPTDSSECQTVRGARGYIGTKSTTKRGHTCQRWDKQEPQDHTQEAKTNDATYFPDPTLSDAANYCRNPTGKDDLWCYITYGSADYSWDFCDVPICDCKAVKGDLGYMGTVSITKKGYMCQRWDSQTPISHTHHHQSNDASYFPDETLADAANYCRNPGGSKDLWCYVVDGGTDEWDWCDVPDCVDTESRCDFPFTSPKTGIQWNRCALEMWASSTQYCIDKFGQKLTCTKNHRAETIKDDGCHFPYYTEEGGSPVSHCTEGKTPWCGTSENVWEKWKDNAKYCLSDYGLGSNQHKWTDKFSSPVKNKQFQNMVQGFLSDCNQYKSVDDLPFPPRDDGMNAFESIAFINEKVNKYSAYLNMFPTLTAPWPVLLHLIADIPRDECEWVWRRWLNNEPMITYGIYTKQILSSTKAGCRASAWNTYTVPRIKEDGGICGQLSTQAKYTWVCLGEPANLVSEPAHVALFALGYNPQVAGDPLAGPYIFKRYQGVANELDAVTSSHSPLDMHSLTLAGQPVRRQVNLDFERGIVYTINKGYDAFEKARITQNVFHRLPAVDKPDALFGLIQEIKDNPYYAHLLYDIADFLTGEVFTFRKTSVRYPTTCRDVPRLDELRTDLKAIADTHFYDKRVFPQTYLDVVTRIVYPASCCQSDSSILSGLEAEVAKMDAWKTKFGDYVRMNVAKCESNAAAVTRTKRDLGQGSSRTECSVCERVKPILVRNGNAFGNDAIETFASDFDDTMDMLLNVPNPDKKAVIQFLRDVADNIPHVFVSKEEWTITIQYDITLKKLIALLKQDGQIAAAADLEAYKARLADGTSESNIEFWMDLADRKKLAGKFEDVLAEKQA